MALLGSAIRDCPRCRNEKQLNHFWGQFPPASHPLSVWALSKCCKKLPEKDSRISARFFFSGVREYLAPCQGGGTAQGPACTAHGCTAPASTPELHT